MEQLIRDIVVTGSAFSIGSALFAGWLSLRMVRVNARRYISFAAAKLGYALVAGTILLRVLPDNTIPLDRWSVAYISGLTIAALGFMGVGRAIRREYVDWESEGIELEIHNGREDNSGGQPAP